jgi:hypothetical protein
MRFARINKIKASIDETEALKALVEARNLENEFKKAAGQAMDLETENMTHGWSWF